MVQLDTREDIFAVGDVHGDRDRLVALLAGAKLVASVRDPHWIAGKSILIFTGDLIDKGPKIVGVLQFVLVLQRQAHAAGGRVIATMGNHENDFLRDPASDKVQDFVAQLDAAKLSARKIAACQGELGAFLCGMPFAARVNEWFFSHAGNTAGRTMPQLIADLQNGVDRDGFATPQLTGENSVIAARLGAQGPGGRSWFEESGKADETLDANTAALGVAHIVQGHQHSKVSFPGGHMRNLGELYQWHGKLFVLDVGMSEDIDDSLGGVLHIRHAPVEVDVICPNGGSMRLWDPTQKLDSAKGFRCGG